MSFLDWVGETKRRYERDGWRRATADSLYELYKGGLRRVGRVYNYGTPVWERDWDVLVILDACRDDVFKEVYGDDSRFETVRHTNSVGSMSEEWMHKTFADAHAEEMARTAYVTGNPYSQDHIASDRLAALEEVWRYAWDTGRGTIRPEPVSDAAIRLARERSPERTIVHYMQPHTPYLSSEQDTERVVDPGSFGDYGGVQTEIDLLREGGLSQEEHWRAYRENLEIAVEQILETLCRSVDGRVVFTADHGNAFGEYGVYGHPNSVPLPPIKRVPWAVHSASDTGEYTPESREFYKQQYTEADADTEEKLRNLGYM